MGTLNNLFGAAEHTVLLIRQPVYYAGTFLQALFLPKADDGGNIIRGRAWFEYHRQLEKIPLWLGFFADFLTKGDGQ